MPNAEQLIREGNLDGAIAALTSHLRDNPADTRGRTTLFELLCFAGEYERAAKHLAVIGEGNTDIQMGALLYQGALHAEGLRREMFEGETYPGPLGESAAEITGSLNGKPFARLADSDPRIGPRLEVFGAGDYFWIPFRQIQVIEIQAPKRLRDLLWIPARVTTSPEFQQRELGEVLLPALNPLTYQHPDGPIRLGQMTEWCADEAGREHPYGQKMLLAGEEEIPILEIRRLEIQVPVSVPA
jgi:type VI secretion system protein ImpE